MNPLIFFLLVGICLWRMLTPVYTDNVENERGRVTRWFIFFIVLVVIFGVTNAPQPIRELFEIFE